ncbi:hypothetical protein NM688_g1209 [Phlebia brevispora]|uniref:Uncharacterized protein n=1 Tax=Phlebia brevispora TaxID=194682 RepID=A0ACC1TCH3_9APHY|nr:hypothetical protein NM688_g1209 [Phlebia brevispora]
MKALLRLMLLADEQQSFTCSAETEKIAVMRGRDVGYADHFAKAHSERPRSEYSNAHLVLSLIAGSENLVGPGLDGTQSTISTRTHTMSASPAYTAIVAAYEQDLTANYCTTSALGKNHALSPCTGLTSIPALAAYEYVITFRHEHDFLSRRKRTISTWLFIVNRYMLLTSIAVQAMPISAQFVVAVPLIISAVFSALRVFALLNHGYVTATCVLVLGLAPVGLTLYESSYMVYEYTDDPVLGSSCYQMSAFSNIFFPGTCSIALLGRLTPVVSDIIALLTTWLKTYRHVKQAACAGIGASLGSVLIQYGTLYFIAICATNVISLVISLIPSTTGLTIGVVEFMTVLPNIMLSRFLLNLQQADAQSRGEPSQFSHFSAPNFHVRASILSEIISNLGGPLASGDEAFDDEEPRVDVNSCEECPSELRDYGNAGIPCATRTEHRSGETQVVGMQLDII